MIDLITYAHLAARTLAIALVGGLSTLGITLVGTGFRECDARFTGVSLGSRKRHRAQIQDTEIT